MSRMGVGGFHSPSRSFIDASSSSRRRWVLWGRRLCRDTVWKAASFSPSATAPQYSPCSRRRAATLSHSSAVPLRSWARLVRFSRKVVLLPTLFTGSFWC